VDGRSCPALRRGSRWRDVAARWEEASIIDDDANAEEREHFYPNTQKQ